MPSERFTVATGGATLVGERHAVGSFWSHQVDDADRLPLVLLHAAVADRRSWHRVVPTWSTTRTVVTFDQRGFGESSWNQDPWDPVTDLLAVLDAADVDRAVLVGNSNGGGLAMRAARRVPDRVAAMILIGSAFPGAPPPTDLHPDVLAADRAIDQAMADGDLELANRLELSFWLDGPHVGRPRADAQARELFLAMNGRALAAPATGPEPDDPGVWDDLEQLAQPTLFLHGEHDLAHGGERAEEAARRMPDARFKVLTGTAHLPALDAHQRTLAACAAFLDGLP